MYRTMESKNYASAEAAIKDLKDGYMNKNKNRIIKIYSLIFLEN